MSGVAAEFINLVCDGLFFMFIFWLLEGNIQKLWYKYKMRRESTIQTSDSNLSLQNLQTEDSDVVNERNRILDLYERHLIKDEALGVIELTKKFGDFVAVDHLSFGVYKKECFGLLGINGAGKTTTFRMLTGDLTITNGNAFVGKAILCENLNNFQSHIGYCPQFDALLDCLTGREMLFLFARLRGMRETQISNNVKQLIEMVDLQEHADKTTQTYSGGNERKLSLAIAMIGHPQVIFLDEPTTGVDPAARRKIWSTLVYYQEKFQSSIILTSHSMEECETLCSRIGIMVNGKFKCLGSTQHLRSKFGQGYTVMIKIKREMIDSNHDYIKDVQSFIVNTFPSAVLSDFHQNLLHYQIKDTQLKWSFIFKMMENAKNDYNFEDYLVSGTTLEQIFLAFARSQRENQNK